MKGYTNKRIRFLFQIFIIFFIFLHNILASQQGDSNEAAPSTGVHFDIRKYEICKDMPEATIAEKNMKLYQLLCCFQIPDSDNRNPQYSAQVRNIVDDLRTIESPEAWLVKVALHFTHVKQLAESAHSKE